MKCRSEGSYTRVEHLAFVVCLRDILFMWMQYFPFGYLIGIRSVVSIGAFVWTSWDALECINDKSDSLLEIETRHVIGFLCRKTMKKNVKKDDNVKF